MKTLLAITLLMFSLSLNATLLYNDGDQMIVEPPLPEPTTGYHKVLNRVHDLGINYIATIGDDKVMVLNVMGDTNLQALCDVVVLPIIRTHDDVMSVVLQHSNTPKVLHCK